MRINPINPRMHKLTRNPTAVQGNSPWAYRNKFTLIRQFWAWFTSWYHFCWLWRRRRLARHLVVFYLCKRLFSGLLQFKGNGQNHSKNRDWAPLKSQEKLQTRTLLNFCNLIIKKTGITTEDWRFRYTLLCMWNKLRNTVSETYLKKVS